MKKVNNIKNILFINFGGIGDEILFFPTLSDFKKEFPETNVTLMLEPRSASAVNLTNTVDKIIKFDVKSKNKIFAFLKLLQLIRKGSYDVVISVGSNKFISILLFLSGVKTRIGYDTGTLARKLLSTTIALNKQQYAANMYHDLLKGLDIFKDTPLPEIIVPEQALIKAEQMFRSKR